MIGAALAVASFLVVAPANAAAAPTATTSTRTWQFRVTLDDREIGSHVFRVEGDGAARTVSIEARFKVSFLFIDAYRYAHTAREQWSGGCLLSLDSRTEDGDRKLAVEARLVADGFVVNAGGARTKLAERCPMSFAYWDPAILNKRWLLNSQTGKLEQVRIDTLAVEQVPARGAQTPARRYRLSAGNFSIDVWYDVRTGEWVRLETLARGRTLAYTLE